MSEFTEAEKEALTAYRPREYNHASVRTHVQAEVVFPSNFNDTISMI